METELSKLTKEAESLSKEIHNDLKAIDDVGGDEFSRWFAKQVILTFKEPKLIELKKEAWKLTPVPKNSNRITAGEIIHARAYDWNLLLDIDKGYALCPFHKDKRPSFHITSRNRAFCFSCSWSGDQIKFLMERDNLSFPDAVKKLQ